MNMKRSNGGFTLVEFVVTIAIASMITLAATSMLLLGLRIHHKSNATAGTLNTVSMLYSVMDTIASENKIDNPKPSDSYDINGKQNWCIKAGSTAVKYNYDSTLQLGEISLNESAFINNVKSSYVTINSSGLLTIYIETDHDEYTFSIYCRKGVEPAGS